MALIDLGMIQTPDDLPGFAQNLYVCLVTSSSRSRANEPEIFSVKKTPEEQTKLLAELDAHGAPKTTR